MHRRFAVLSLVSMLLLSLLAPISVRAEAPVTPLVLIHGMLGDPEGTWETAIPYFEQRGYVSGETLFAIDLRGTPGENEKLGILGDTAFAAGKLREIVKVTGAAQVDLMGKDRAGLIVRFLAVGETAPLVRRAISLDAPHAGMLSEAAFAAQLQYAKVDPAMVSGMSALPAPDSPILTTLKAREARFSDHSPTALAIASTWQDGQDPALTGHDGLTPVESQLAWPGARTFTSKIGPSKAEIEGLIAVGAGLVAMGFNAPVVKAPYSEANLQAAYEFLSATDLAAPARACEPACQDWAQLAGHWSEATVKAMLPHSLPYVVDASGQRLFEPNRPMTRAEFAYGLVKALGLQEQLGATAFGDLYGHWSLGYVQAAVTAKLVNGLTADSFGPDARLTRAQAATLVVRAKGLAAVAPAPGGQWYEGYIKAAADAGIMKGDERGFRPDDPVTMAEAAVILSRSFPRQ